MRIAMTLVAISTLWAQSGLAQYLPGDTLFLGRTGAFTSELFRVTAAGAVQTAAVVPAVAGYELVVAPDNMSVVMFANANSQRRLYQVAPDGTVTSLGPVLGTAMEVDEQGRLLLIDVNGLYAVTAQRSVVTLKQFWTYHTARAATMDLDTGDLLFFRVGTFMRTRPDSTPGFTAVGSLGGGSNGTPAGMHFDPASGDLAACDGQPRLLRVRIGPPFSFSTQRGPFTFGIDRDPAKRDFIVSSPYYLARWDIANNVLTKLVSLPAGLTGSGGIVVAQSRHLVAQNPVSPGQSLQLRISSPAEPGATYYVAASFGMRPGFVVAGRRVDLVPDALLAASLSGSSLFRNFSGQLNSFGEGGAAVLIPSWPVLSGARFYLACITVKQGNIGIVSEPIGVTIQ